LLLPQSKFTKLACPKQLTCVGEFVVGFGVGADVMHELSNSCVILTHCTQSLQPHTDAMPVAGVTTPAGKPGKSCIVDLIGLPSVPEQSVLV